MKQVSVYVLLMFVFCCSCQGQQKTEFPKDDIKSKTKDIVTSHGPSTITRNIIQDRKGNLWMATWEGVFRYEVRLNDKVGQGKSFTNITSDVSSARFFSALEDGKGNLWFGTIGSGVFFYDGYFFKNYTTRDGLINNEVTCIYQDKAGDIWFGANGGTSCYDGRTFRNYTMNGDSMSEDKTGKSLPDVRPPNEVNAIIEDKLGRLWFATRGRTFVYDRKTFTVFFRDGVPFTNVRTILEDKNGNIWLGGNDGLWRYDGNSFTNISQNFGGFIYQDSAGNIWTSAEESPRGTWALSRYDAKSLSDTMPTATIIKSKEGMIFGIVEAYDGSIWFGTANGVYRYDGNGITGFNGDRSRE